MVRILDSVENMDKYRRYEADYTHRLMAKYFSKKNFCGGKSFPIISFSALWDMTFQLVYMVQSIFDCILFLWLVHSSCIVWLSS